MDLFCVCLCLTVLQPCGHLLGKGWPHSSPVCDVFLCICHFPTRCPGSGVVPDCINSRSLPSFLFWEVMFILFEEIQDAWPGNLNGTILAILNLHVARMHSSLSPGEPS